MQNAQWSCAPLVHSLVFTYSIPFSKFSGKKKIRMQCFNIMEKANTMKPLLKGLNSGFSYSVRFWDSQKK